MIRHPYLWGQHEVSDNSGKAQAVTFSELHSLKGDRGGTVVEVLCYKSEGRWFDPSWCHWNFSLT